MKKEHYVFFEDPGHAWLRVPQTEIKKLNIGSHISICSYIKGKYVYLEEDCDAPRFLKAKYGETVSLQELIDKHIISVSISNSYSSIRNFDGYIA